MRWCVIRNPEISATAVIAETALEVHRARGWHRVSDWHAEPDDLRSALATGAVVPSDRDLDAPEPIPEPLKKAAVKNESKETN